MTIYDRIMCGELGRAPRGILGILHRAQLKNTATYTEAKFCNTIQSWLQEAEPESFGKPLWGSDLENYFMTAYALWNFDNAGKKVYEISYSLCQMFEATHIKKVPTELLRVPYPAILLECPKNFLECAGPQGERAFATSLFVCEVMDKLNESDEHLTRMLRIAVSDSGFFVHFWIPLDRPEVHECVDRGIEIIEYYHASRQRPDDDTFGATQEEGVRRVFEFVMKCLLYITGERADIVYEDNSKELFAALRRATSPGKKKILERRIANYGLPRYRVGSKIVLSREEKQGYENVKKGLWTLSYRFCVQGHYRQQACGEKHLERKQIYIKPFWKGPEFAEEVNKVHKVVP